MRKMLVALLALVSCAPQEPRVGGAYLIDAESTVKAADGPLVVLGKDPIPGRVSGPVRLAADRNLPYQQVLEAARAVKAAGGRPVLLVSRREYVEALPDPGPPFGAGDPPAIRLRATAEGKACVSPPDNDEATCVSRKDQKRVDRAFVRQILTRAVDEFGLNHVKVRIEDGVTWGDAVRAIDGARTCCGAKAGIVVAVEPSY